MKKKLFSLFLIVVLCLSFAACGDDTTRNVTATALYVDNELVGVMDSAAEMQAVLDEIQAQALAAYDSGDLRAAFVQDVRMEEGEYPPDEIIDKETLTNLLTAKTEVDATYTVQAGDTFSGIAEKHNLTAEELQELNPEMADTPQVDDVLNVGTRQQSFLQVKVICTVYKEGAKIPYKTKTIYRNDKETSWSQVTTEGVDGAKNVTTITTYVDGWEEERTVEEEILKEAVAKVVEVGTKKVPSSDSDIVQGDGVTLDTWVWPVPICHNVYQGYSSGHPGIDISSGPVPVMGKPAVAANGGEVVYASTAWNDGYGTTVKIQHANGLVTVYSHLQSLSVEVGQKVSAGQQIGLVGNTGRSSGPHLYFEVIKNGVNVNPLNYVTP